MKSINELKKGGRLHYPDKSRFGHTLCGTTSTGQKKWLADETEEVTCKRCLNLINQKDDRLRTSTRQLMHQ